MPQGAAVARRFYGVVSHDAPAWLARLADAGAEAPAELACFVVARVHALAWWETLIHHSVRAAFERVREERYVPSLTAEHLRKAALPEVREQVVGAALRAAFEFGYAEPEPDDEYEPSDSEIAAVLVWTPHLSQLTSFFGDELALRLRASQPVQSLFFGPQELGEHRLMIIQETFCNERLAWVRALGESDVFQGLAGASGLPSATRDHLERLLELVQAGGAVARARGRAAASRHATRFLIRYRLERQTIEHG